MASIHSISALYALLASGRQLDIPQKFHEPLQRCYNVFNADVAPLKRTDDLADKAAEQLQISAAQASHLLQAFQSETNIDPKHAEFWTHLMRFYFDERLDAILCVALLLRLSDSDASSSDSINAVLKPIITGDFSKTVLSRIRELSTIGIPPTDYASDWAKQYLREQKALLEVHFLLFYSNIKPSGESLLQILQLLQDTDWGQRQANEEYFDGEARRLANDIPTLMSIVALAHLNLEGAILSGLQDFQLSTDASPALPQDLVHPSVLPQIHAKVCALYRAYPHSAGPLLLGWTFLLSLVTDSLVNTSPLPPAYAQFACAVLPLDQQPPLPAGRAAEDSNRSSRPVYQVLAETALGELDALTSMKHMLSAELLGSTATAHITVDPMLPGYLAITHALLSAIPQIVHPAYLPDALLHSLIDVFTGLYRNPAAAMLRGHLWNLFDDSETAAFRGEWLLIELAASRFPANPSPLLRLLHALGAGNTTVSQTSSASSDDVELSRRCSDKVDAFLSDLRTVTVPVQAVSQLVPLPYEPASEMDGGSADVVATRDTVLGDTQIRIAAGTIGRIVSSPGEKPVIIQWDVSSARTDCSGWAILGGLLRQALGVQHGKSATQRLPADRGDVFALTESSTSATLQWEDSEAAARGTCLILEVMQDVLLRNPSRSSAILRDMALHDKTDFIRALLSILVGASGKRHSDLAGPIYGTLGALLPALPGPIWTQLRATPGIFGSGQEGFDMLANERQRRSFTNTLSALCLLQNLIIEARRSTFVNSAKSSELKGRVLRSALDWALQKVWLGFSSWQYQNLQEKHVLASQLGQIVQTVTVDAGASPALRGPIFDGLNRSLRHTLLGSEAAVWLSPSMEIVLSGRLDVQSALKHGRMNLRNAVEASISAHLQVLSKCLRLMSADNSNTLATFCVACCLPTSRSQATENSVIASVFAYISPSSSSNVILHACKLATRLCEASLACGDSAERPSFLAALGGISAAHTVTQTLLSLAVDSFMSEAIQAAIWTLMRAIVQTQVGLAALLAEGVDAFALRHGVLATKVVDGTILALIEEILADWSSASQHQPNLLCQSLELLLILTESDNSQSGIAKAIITERRRSLINIACQKETHNFIANAAHSALLDGTDFDDSYRMCSRAAALRLLCTERPSADTNSIDAYDAHLQAILRQAFILFVEESAASAQRIGDYSDIQQVLHSMCEGLRIQDAVRTHQSNSVTEDNANITPYASVAALLPRLEGYYATMSDSARLQSSVDFLHSFNLNWELVRSRISLIDAWTQLAKSDDIAKRAPELFTADTHLLVLKLLAALSQASTLVGQALPYYRSLAQLGENLLEVLARRRIPCPDSAMVTYVVQISTLLGNSSLMSDVMHDPQSLLKLSMLSIAERVLRGLALGAATTSDVRAAALSGVESSVETCLKLCQQSLLQAVQHAASPTLADQLAAVAAVLSGLQNIGVVMRSSLWLAQADTLSLYDLLCRTLASQASDIHGLQITKACVDLAMVLAADDTAAERLALSGITYSICSMPLSPVLESGQLHACELGVAPAERLASHEVWRGVLALHVQLASQLSSSATYLQDDVLPFHLMFRKQLQQSWIDIKSRSSHLTMPALSEARIAASLLDTLSARRGQLDALDGILDELVTLVIQVLQVMLDYLHHPNKLVTDVKPTNAAERAWLELDTSIADDETNALQGLFKRPVLLVLVENVLAICDLLVSSMMRWTRSHIVLMREDVDWPNDAPLLAVVDDDDDTGFANVGSLLELAAVCIRLGDQPTAGVKEDVLPTVHRVKAVAARLKERTWTLACSQIAVGARYLCKEDMLDQSNEDDKDRLQSLMHQVTESSQSPVSSKGAATSKGDIAEALRHLLQKIQNQYLR